MSEAKSELEQAIENVTSAPLKMEAWDAVESLAAELDSPDAVLRAYRVVLDSDLSPDSAVTIGQRATEFHEEWYGDDLPGLVELLRRILEVNPTSEWAFQKLSVALTVAQHWDELLALYTRSIAATADESRRIQLLDEAYQIAKDVANQPDQAIDFLRAKLALEPSEAQSLALERLLERHERWSDLLALWQEQYSDPNNSDPNSAGKVQTLVRIAELNLDKLENAPEALNTIEEALTIEPHNDGCAGLLERLVTLDDVDLVLRQKALRLVYRTFGEGRAEDVIRVLLAALPLFPESERADVHGELGRRLSDNGQHGAALEQYGALLLLRPDSTDVQRALRQEAVQTEEWEQYASAVTAAANGCSDGARRAGLLADAATTHLEKLGDETGAVDLLRAALDTEGIPASNVLVVGRRLNELLERAGRHAERLIVLGRVADAETDDSSRRALIGDLALLAEELGEVDRALAAWQRRVQTDPTDLQAQTAFVELLDKEGRWPDLVEALTDRAAHADNDEQHRADLVRLATIQEDKLERQEDALVTWQQIQNRFGDAPDVIAALSRLLRGEAQWTELTQLLERSCGQQIALLADQLASLGTSYRRSVGDDDKAIECYRRALAVDIGHVGAKAALHELLEQESTRNVAAEALVHSMRSTGDSAGLLSLVSARLAGTDDPRRQIEILREAADLAQHEASDPALALDYVTQLFPLTPRDRVLEDRMVALCRAVGEWEACLRAYRGASSALMDDPHAYAELCFREAMIRETEAGDPKGALELCLTIVSVQPEHREAVPKTVALAGALGEFQQTCMVVLKYAETIDGIPEELMASMYEAAQQTDGGLLGISTALSHLLPKSRLQPRHQAELYARLAKWQLEHLNDSVAATVSLLSSVDLDPNRGDTLRALAEQQRADGGADLYKTLRRLCEVEGDNLNHYREAVLVAQNSLSAQEVQESLQSLLSRAVSAWRQTASATSDIPPEELSAWALQSLVELHLRSEAKEAAMDLLLDAAQWPFEPNVCQGFRKRAAAIASQELNDPERAMDMYRSVLAHAPDDEEAFDALAQLYEQGQRLPDLLGLRYLELQSTGEDERRFALRLQIASLIDKIDAHGGRLDVLVQNLEDEPGHPETLTSLRAHLLQMGQGEKLAQILAGQATVLEGKGEVPRSAEVWGEAARIQEEVLGNVEEALSAYRKVAELSPTLAALDALARLYMERSESGSAVPWLEQALNLADATERPGLVMRLAKAHMSVGATDEAIGCLAAATAGDDALVELRTMLAKLYRDGGQYALLADTLTGLLPHVGDDEVLDIAREAAALYHNELGTPAAAVPALRRALKIDAQDRQMRIMLGRSLCDAQQFDEAKSVLNQLVEEFGRRRSKERAAIHVELANVWRAEGNADTAMEELELASKMDVGNAQILRSLGCLARDQGDTDKAEQALRALLLIVRRQPPGDDETAVGVSEVLFELHRIAKMRGDEEQASELLVSVREAVVDSDVEVCRLRHTLLDHDEFELCAEILQERIDASTEPMTRALLLGYLAQLQEGPLKRPKDALQSRLLALSLCPYDEALHTYARKLAQEVGAVDKYVECIEEAIAQERREEEAAKVADLHMRVGEVAESELKDLDKARTHYEKAQECSDAPANALFALARVCGRQGDTEAQARALDELTTLALADGPEGAQADALYSLAELQATQPDLVDRSLELLGRALTAEPRYRQAATILRLMADTSKDDAKVLALYEANARRSQDASLLLDALERSVAAGAAPGNLREAVELATELKETERAARLLERAVAEARQDDAIAAAGWAFLALSEHHMQSGNLRSAKELLLQIEEVASTPEIRTMVLDLSERAQEADDLQTACEVLEVLRSRQPSSREVWLPLIQLYRNLGNDEGLIQLVEETLPTLQDASERTSLRLEKAQSLIDAGRDVEAVATLKEACMDSPDDTRAPGILEETLRRIGDEQGLADFLWQRFHEAKERQSEGAMADVALRLGNLLDSLGQDSLGVLHQALEVSPKSPELLRAVLGRMGEDTDNATRANFMERLLEVEEESVATGQLALALVALYEELGDTTSAERSLILGHRTCPKNRTLKERLEGWYEQTEQWRKLAQMKAAEADTCDNATIQVRLLQEAASVYRDKLIDLEASSECLGRAVELAPGDPGLVLTLVADLSQCGKGVRALEILGEALENVEGTIANELRLTRSELLRNEGQLALAVADLEAVLEHDRETVAPLLLATLGRWRVASQTSQNAEEERSATLRLIELSAYEGDTDGAQSLLHEWIEGNPEDVDALMQFRDMERKAEHWDGVVVACARLVPLQQGEAQVKDALLLSEAATHCDSAGEELRTALERVHADQPQVAEIRDLLRTYYVENSFQRELVNVLLADAEYSEDETAKYEKLRTAAELLVNELGDPEAAVVPAKQAQTLRPNDHETMTLLADILIASAKVADAVAMLEPAIAAHKRRSPELAALQYRMAKAAEAQEDKESQLSWLKKAFDVDRKNASIAAELAHLATALQDYDLALKPLRAITLMDEPGPVSRVMALLWEAKIEHARGNRAKAELWAKKALREDPNYSEASEFLSQISE